MQICHRFEIKKAKLPLYDLKTGIRTTKKHYLAFKVNRPIILLGFGVYGPISNKESLNIEFAVFSDDFCNPINQKICLYKERHPVDFTGHRNVTPLMFRQAIHLKCSQQYILYFDCDSYLTYRGICGLPKIRTRDCTFVFSDDFDSISLTTKQIGNFPEIYFDIPKSAATKMMICKKKKYRHLMMNSEVKHDD